jgi:hypothetical protein
MMTTRYYHLLFDVVVLFYASEDLFFVVRDLVACRTQVASLMLQHIKNELLRVGETRMIHY